METNKEFVGRTRRVLADVDPFNVGDLIAKDLLDACDRLEQAEKKIEQIDKGEQLLLVRPRQMGKTTEMIKQLRPEVKIEESNCQKRLKGLEDCHDDLVTACKRLIEDLELIEQDESITACQCLAKAPDDITAPLPCNYCAAKIAIAKAEKLLKPESETPKGE